MYKVVLRQERDGEDTVLTLALRSALTFTEAAAEMERQYARVKDEEKKGAGIVSGTPDSFSVRTNTGNVHVAVSYVIEKDCQLKKKMEIVAEARDGVDVSGKIKGGEVSYDEKRGRVVIRRNIRKELSEAIRDSGISRRQLALFMGLPPQHMSSFLTGAIPLPLSVIEEFLFLLDGEISEEKEGEGA